MRKYNENFRVEAMTESHLVDDSIRVVPKNAPTVKITIGSVDYPVHAEYSASFDAKFVQEQIESKIANFNALNNEALGGRVTVEQVSSNNENLECAINTAAKKWLQIMCLDN